MTRVGLTGNIGSGKTLVSEIFRILGVPVFHADAAAKKLYDDPAVRDAVVRITGSAVLDEEGAINRKKLAARVFNDKDALDKINGLVHPMVRKAFLDFSTLHSDEPYTIYEAAILIESGYYREMDRLIIVYAPENIRLERVMARDQAAVMDIRERMRNQSPDEDRLHLADWVIYNDGSRMVVPQVLQIDRELRTITN